MAQVNPRFIDSLKKSNKRFTIILGSGYHKQALQENNILSSWEQLLKSQNNNFEPSSCYPLDFERLITQKITDKNKSARKVETTILSELCFDIKSAERKALNFHKDKYPTSIFNPYFVSDVISLNFDTIALRLCAEKAGINYEKINKKEFFFTNNTSLARDVLCYEIPFDKDGSIRFWFPHGSYLESKNITLGTREYSKRMNTVEKN